MGAFVQFTITVTAYPDPVAQVVADITIIQGQAALLTAAGGVGYHWSPSAGLSCGTCAIATTSPEEATVYCVTVTDIKGCTDSACVTVTVDMQCENIFVPTAFSPNNDGQNDSWQIRSNCLKEIYVKIFNRWGDIIFENENINQGWDGKFKGEQMNTGVFVYYLQAKSTTGDVIFKKGNVALIR